MFSNCFSTSSAPETDRDSIDSHGSSQQSSTIVGSDILITIDEGKTTKKAKSKEYFKCNKSGYFMGLLGRFRVHNRKMLAKLDLPVFPRLKVGVHVTYDGSNKEKQD